MASIEEEIQIKMQKAQSQQFSSREPANDMDLEAELAALKAQQRKVLRKLDAHTEIRRAKSLTKL